MNVIRRPVARYATALGFMAAALAVRLVLDPVIRDRLPYASVLAAVAAAAWFAGVGPSLLAAIIGFVAGYGLFVYPYGQVDIIGVQGLAMSVLYWISALSIVALGRGAHDAARRAEVSAREAQERGAALAETERRLAERSDEDETILDLMPVGVFHAIDQSCGRVVGNRAAHELFASPGDASRNHAAPTGDLALGCRFFQAGRELPIEDLPLQRAARGETVKEQEYEVMLGDGTVKHLFGSAGPLHDQAGRVRGSIAALMDITARRTVEIELERAKREAEAQAQLLERQARTLHTLLENVPEGILMMTGAPDFRVIALSRHGREMIGLPEEEIIGRRIGEHVRPLGLCRLDGTVPEPEEIPSYRALFKGEHVRSEEWMMRTREGTEFRVMVRCVPIRDADGAIVGAVKCWEDITRQKAAEEALRRSEALYRAIGESIDFGVWVCDAEGRNVYSSKSYLELVGMTQEECAEFGWGDALHPEDRERTIAAWKECVRTGSAWDIEHRFRGVDGQWHPILARGVPVHDAEGRIIGWTGINLDISRLKLAEERLREADRRKDEFLATLAHELRNPLAPIRNAVHLMQHKGPPDPELLWASRIIDRQVSQMARLLDDLLDLSRVELDKLDLLRERVTIGAVLESALETSRPALETGRHTLEVTLDAADAVVIGDHMRLAQVFANLVNNAAKYTDSGGLIQVTARRDTTCVVVRVRDNGIGFRPDEAAGLFEMFSQTESARAKSGGGLGIGLALVRGLVEKHGGKVSAHSDGPGRGSEFSVELPLAMPAEITRPSSEEHLPALRGVGRRVLIADDNRDAADSLAMLLRLRGHEVHTVHDGHAALAAAAEFAPDAAVIDLGMPGLGGIDVAERIRGEPWGDGILLVALTGWGQQDDRRRTADAGFDHHLVKPADPAELDQLLQSSPARR
jgi:PAS domain S-box-containing protein